MITTILVVVPAVLVASVLGVCVILREVRRNRRMVNARLDAQGEALRMIAGLVQEEQPPDQPRKQRPDLKLYRGGRLGLIAVLVTAATAWTGQHLRAAATAAVGATAVLGAVAAGVLLLSSGPDGGAQRALPPPSGPASLAPWSAIPTTSQSAAPPARPSATAPAPTDLSGYSTAPADVRRTTPTTGPGRTGPPWPLGAAPPLPTPSVSVSASVSASRGACAVIDLAPLMEVSLCV